jgi:hypothetical protein
MNIEANGAVNITWPISFKEIVSSQNFVMDHQPCKEFYFGVSLCLPNVLGGEDMTPRN